MSKVTNLKNPDPYIEETYRKWLDFLKNENFDYSKFDKFFKSEDFNKQNQEDKHKKVFVFDGIIDKKVWDKQKPKIMFLLRESYDWYNIIKGIHPRDGNNPHFFPNILKYKLVIEELYNKEFTDFKSLDLDYKKTCECKTNTFNTIAYLDIKKFLDKKTSNYKDIIGEALCYKELLKEHINLIDPDVVYCDDFTYNAYKKIYEIDYEQGESKTLFDRTLPKNKKKLPRLYYHHLVFSNFEKKRLLVRFNHPSYFRDSLISKLIDGLQNIQINEDNPVNIHKMFNS